MKKTFLTTLLILSFSIVTFSQISKQTFDYAIKDGDTLRLDKYELTTESDTLKPCIIFMFGGGFVTGTRSDAYFIPYLEKLANNGYTVVSIDYRLGLKKTAESMKNGEKMKATAFPGLLAGAVDVAVQDLYDATNFVLENADNWNIDKSRIITNGSSAGAVSVLQGEYYICSNHEFAKVLPVDFRYAGIISFAGAIFSTKGNLKWEKQPAPIQFFHGNADSNVPYNKLKIFKYGFFGSKHISGQMEKMNSPYYFYDINNAAHEIAVSPMNLNIPEINVFLDKFIFGKQQLIIHTMVDQIGKAEMKKKFGIKDYIMSNFAPPAN